jgi:hypothetical protein
MTALGLAEGHGNGDSVSTSRLDWRVDYRYCSVAVWVAHCIGLRAIRGKFTGACSGCPSSVAERIPRENPFPTKPRNK